MFKRISVIVLVSLMAWAYQAMQPAQLNIYGSVGVPPVAATATLLVGLLVLWGYQAIQPPRPKICGSQGGPPVTAARIKLSDGRYLAYKEYGVPRAMAKYKIIYVHGFNSTRDNVTILSNELAQELGIYLVSFDRAGYGESDPNPKKTVKSTALDMEELADQLGLGSKFYVIGLSMGGQVIWTCLKYIPHRLAGAALLCPVANYWWPGFPDNLSKQVYNRKSWKDQWAFRVAHHIPWLTYWWNTQNWFSACSWIDTKPENYSAPDTEILMKLTGGRIELARVFLQGDVYGSIIQDLTIGFGKWEFDPMDLENPFPNNEGSVHIWQGDEDWTVPVSMQRYIAGKLPWIQYHEVKGTGHLFLFTPGVNEAILRGLLLGEK